MLLAYEAVNIHSGRAEPGFFRKPSRSVLKCTAPLIFHYLALTQSPTSEEQARARAGGGKFNSPFPGSLSPKMVGQ